MAKSKKPFTDKEMEILKKNPYTHRVTRHQIQFTAEFKEEFWASYKSGKCLRLIIQELGYDPDILGHRRIEGIAAHIREQSTSEDGFHTGYRKHRKKEPLTNPENYPSDKALARMQNEIIYLRQELEFIKKIIKSDPRNGQRQ